MQKDLLPEEVESVSSIAMGFTDLANGNPELAYRILVDILAGMNECVPPSIFFLLSCSNHRSKHSNDNVRRHLSASTQLFPRGSLRHSIRMTDRGPIIDEAEADSSSDTESVSKISSSTQQRGPIAEMLYSRWLEGLRRATGLY